MAAAVEGPRDFRSDVLDREIEEGLTELREAVPPDAFRAIASQFARDSAEWSRALAIAVSRGDAQEAGRSAHKLAGIFGQVGLRQIAALARDASREDSAEAMVAARDLLDHCDLAVAAIRRITC